MKTAIVVASKHGTTVEIARRISDALGGDAQIFNLDDDPHPNVTDYNTVVLGTAIYAGDPRAQMKAYLKLVDLSGKRLGLFISGMLPSADQQAKQLEDAFPAGLHEQAVTAKYLGGAYQFDKLSRFERFVVKRFAKAHEDVDAIDDDSIAEFARELAAK